MQTVFVALYSHKHGDDIRVFKTYDAACSWKAEIADNWWDTEFPTEDKPDPLDIGDAYFEMMNSHLGEEYFSITEASLED